MPRPKNGYLNSSGLKIPGTHDPISRFKESGGLIQWAYKRGSEGLPLYDRAAIDIGSTVHHMAEMDLKGRPDREIEAYTHDCLVAPDHLRKAFASFGQFRQWRQSCQVRAIAQECPLVSEAWQYGGTPDTIAMIGNRVGLIEFKTSPKPYPDHLVAMAAHGKLWEENHPDHALNGGYHLIILPKDGSDFQHHAYDDLSLHWKLFRLYLEAYRLEKGGELPKVNGEHRLGKEVMPNAESDNAAQRHHIATPQPVNSPLAGADKKAPAPSARKRTPRPKTVMPSPKSILLEQSRPLSMAEILRSYGHVKETVA